MTDEPTAPVRILRAAAGRTSTGRRQHAAAATRLVVGGAALAGTFGMAAAMVAEPGPASVAAPATAPATPAPTTTVLPAQAPRTIVVVRRHVVTGNGSTVVRQSTTPAVRSTPAPTPAPPAAPAPAPNTTTKGS